MKKWIILAGVVIGLWLMVLVSFKLFRSGPETQIQVLKKDNVKLRVVAENYELKYKIFVLEEKLKAISQGTKQTPTRIVPVPNGANVNVKSK